MIPIQETLAAADDCRRAIGLQRRTSQKEFYRDLERAFLGIAAVKEWLHDTEKAQGQARRLWSPDV